MLPCCLFPAVYRCYLSIRACMAIGVVVVGVRVNVRVGLGTADRNSQLWRTDTIGFSVLEYPTIGKPRELCTEMRLDGRTRK